MVEGEMGNEMGKVVGPGSHSLGEMKVGHGTRDHFLCFLLRGLLPVEEIQPSLDKTIYPSIYCTQ